MSYSNQHRPSESPLLRTKVTPPRIPPDFVHRPRLTKIIDRGTQGPLTLISTPTGFGKTILLVEWIQQTVLPVAWLNIDSEDNDPTRFFSYLINAFQIQSYQWH
jgi:LuxR family maltose regulon positive regulatory protein